ncbi:hypothetical protein BKA62DRAFT_678208 [Auriculariales sp. MPI-PUGE-AT-0066]|nr:hypothetical protein BKA62DRAFT_678208 [Auriculariales sp. MPI-PUGE-AT-0066]
MPDRGRQADSPPHTHRTGALSRRSKSLKPWIECWMCYARPTSAPSRGQIQPAVRWSVALAKWHVTSAFRGETLPLPSTSATVQWRAPTPGTSSGSTSAHKKPRLNAVTSDQQDSASLSDTFTNQSSEYSIEYSIRRNRDRSYAEAIFDGRTKLVEINDLLARFGGEEMVTRFDTVCAKARSFISSASFDASLVKAQLLLCLEQEGGTNRDATTPDPVDGTSSVNSNGGPCDVSIGGVYWMGYVADLAGDSTSRRFQWECNHEKYLSHASTSSTTKKEKKKSSSSAAQKHSNHCHNRLSPENAKTVSDGGVPPASSQNSSGANGTAYDKQCQFNAYLHHPNSSKQTIEMVIAPVEFTMQEPPKQTKCSTIYNWDKLCQVVMNAKDVLRAQPTRHGVWLLSVAGKDRTILHVGALGRTCLRLAVIKDTFTSNMATTLAVLHVLHTSSLYELGFLPLFDYSIDNGQISPIRVHLLPDDPQAWDVVTQPPLSTPSWSPFSRSTYCNKVQSGLEALLDIRGLQIAEGYSKRPARVSAVSKYIQILSKIGVLQGLPNPAAAHHSAFDYQCIPATSRDDALRHSRHWAKAPKLDIVHRDISFGNVLVNPDNTLLLVDWECAKGHDLPPSKHIIGTVDTMAIALLPDPDRLSSSRQIPHTCPWHDLETAAYLISKTIMLTFQPPADNAKDWQEVVGNQLWDMSNMDSIRLKRKDFWSSEASSLSESLHMMGAMEHAAFFKALANIPFYPAATELSECMDRQNWTDDQMELAENRLADPLRRVCELGKALPEKFVRTNKL